jgi:endogenous inhibitor of DNA gyrase (YacG/DUF329 family)
MDVAINAWFPAGFSVENDYNITSNGDFTWDEGLNGITLTPGNTYTYYVYGPDDLSEPSYDAQCAHCGTGISDDAAWWPYCSEECRDAANTCTSHNYKLYAEDDTSKTYQCTNCNNTYSVFKTTCHSCGGLGMIQNDEVGGYDTCGNCGGSGVVWE